jgi:uncharacterized protein with PIN domain
LRFIVDWILGGLARWLRMLGHTVVYDSQPDENRLLTLARREGMILLTRDEELYRRAATRNIPALLVAGEAEEERLAQLAQAFHITLNVDMSETKCPDCGGNLREASKQEVADQVPSMSLKLYSEFWKCETPSCGKVYWRGSHWRQINQTLSEARKILELGPVKRHADN